MFRKDQIRKSLFLPRSRWSDRVVGAVRPYLESKRYGVCRHARRVLRHRYWREAKARVSRKPRPRVDETPPSVRGKTDRSSSPRKDLKEVPIMPPCARRYRTQLKLAPCRARANNP